MTTWQYVGLVYISSFQLPCCEMSNCLYTYPEQKQLQNKNSSLRKEMARRYVNVTLSEFRHDASDSDVMVLIFSLVWFSVCVIRTAGFDQR